MNKLISGINAFKDKEFQKHKELFEQLATTQAPEVLFITCSDSRVDPSLITQTKPGDLFICRNAGNIVPPHSHATDGITASIEYAMKVLKVKDIVICGHTDCGAMKGAMNPDSLRFLHHVSSWLAHSLAALEVVKARHGGICADHILEMTEENILLQLKHLETHPSVLPSLSKGELHLHGWIYDIPSGDVTCYDPEKKKFLPITNRYASLHTTEKQDDIDNTAGIKEVAAVN